MDRYYIESVLKEILKDWAFVAIKVCFFVVGGLGGVIAFMFFGMVNCIPTVGFYYRTFHLPDTDTVVWTLFLGYWGAVFGVAFLIIGLIGKRIKKNG